MRRYTKKKKKIFMEDGERDRKGIVDERYKEKKKERKRKKGLSELLEQLIFCCFVSRRWRVLEFFSTSGEQLRRRGWGCILWLNFVCGYKDFLAMLCFNGKNEKRINSNNEDFFHFFSCFTPAKNSFLFYRVSGTCLVVFLPSCVRSNV